MFHISRLHGMIAGAPAPKIRLYMNDVHYYLAGFQPCYPCTMYISGLDFYAFPGIYRMPAGEGRYVIRADDNFHGLVSMVT